MISGQAGSNHSLQWTPQNPGILEKPDLRCVRAEEIINDRVVNENDCSSTDSDRVDCITADGSNYETGFGKIILGKISNGIPSEITIPFRLVKERFPSARSVCSDDKIIGFPTLKLKGESSTPVQGFVRTAQEKQSMAVPTVLDVFKTSSFMQETFFGRFNQRLINRDSSQLSGLNQTDNSNKVWDPGK